MATYESEDDKIEQHVKEFQPLLESYADAFLAYGEKPRVPDWLYHVPTVLRSEHLRKYLDKQLVGFKRRADQNAEWNDRREAEAFFSKGLADTGYSVHYCYYSTCPDLDEYRICYTVALAAPCGNLEAAVERKIFFTTCAPEDQRHFSRFKARARLWGLIEENDSWHSFVLPAQAYFGQLGQPLSFSKFWWLVRRRFEEHALLTGRGLPQELVAEMRRNAWDNRVTPL